MDKRACVEMEIKYVSMFSNILKKQYGNITFDPNQRDKYYHNYMHIIFKKKYKIDELVQYYHQFFEYGHVLYRLECRPNFDDFKFLGDYHLDTNGYYQSPISELVIPVKGNFEIKRVDESCKDLFMEHIYQDSKIYGESYAKGNAKRQWDVLNKASNYDYYLVFDQGQIIGNMNVFVQNQYAKIDDFSVLPTYQRQGVGSYLMQAVVSILKNKGVTHVYLVTGMNDTPKEMYQKWGFKHVGTYHIINKVKQTEESKA
jgi:spore maturation protein CgeE